MSGVDINLGARMRGGFLLQGGSTAGRTSTDSCEIREKLPETAMFNPFCDTSTPWLTQVKVLSVNNVFGGATPWLNPQSIMQARLLKISGQFDC